MGSCNAYTKNTNPPVRVVDAALQVLLSKKKNMLTIRELGRLSICSRTMINAADKAAVWKTIFDECVALSQGGFDNEDGSIFNINVSQSQQQQQ